MKINPVNQSLDVKLFEDAAEAIREGYVYREPEYTGLRIQTAVVVNKGTNAGRATVDLILVDADGKKYVTLIPASLLKTALSTTGES